MERRKKNGIYTLRIILMLCVLICTIGVMKDNVYAAIIETDAAAPAAGNIFIGIEGSYAGDAQAALDRINEIRREACAEGIINPHTNQPLTMDDYVPVKWSAGLEYIARIRAAESSLTMEHTRTNGERCFAISSPEGISGNYEDLAWNWSSGMVSGIEQWYEEKADWVNKTGAVTGHYTSMINPNVTYIGVASFQTKQAIYPNTIAAQFASDSWLTWKGISPNTVDETMAAPIRDCTQLLEVPASWIEKLSVSAEIEKGKTEHVYGVHENRKYGLYHHTWQTSNPAVIDVDEFGNITAVQVGTAVITAVDASGNTTAEANVNVTEPKTVTKSAKTVINRLSSQKSGIKVTWKKQNADGYQVRYAANKNFKSYRSKSISKGSITSTTLKNLKKGKSYYVKVRAYKLDENGKKIYGTFSRVKKIKY